MESYEEQCEAFREEFPEIYSVLVFVLARDAGGRVVLDADDVQDVAHLYLRLNDSPHGLIATAGPAFPIIDV